MGVASGEKGGAGGTANRGSGVVLGQANAFADKLIEAGGFVESAIEATEVAITKVIDQDVNDVGTV